MSENNENLVNVSVPQITIETEMQTSFLDYAMSVIVARALPDVRDGLKPVHRRILFAMGDLAKNYVKSARIVGEVIGKYHPHGDTAVYEAMVRLAQDFSMSQMLVQGQGNFGSMDGDGAAAMRYTEARLAKVAYNLLDDLDKDTVDFRPNFDESLQEPVVLPAKFPNLLVNGSYGIAVGMATNIPTYNLGEIIDATIAVMDNPTISDDELFQIVPGPDFPTGGVILGRSGAYKAHTTGRGSIIVRAKTHIEENKDHQSIIVDEIPYQVNKAQMLVRITELVKEKKLEGISSLRDESSREGVRVVIELKRDAIADVVLNHLFKFTTMQINFPVNIVAISAGKPATFNVRGVLKEFIDFRIDVVRRRTIYELNRARNKAHTLLGLSVAVGNLDEVIALIKSSETPELAKTRLLEKGWNARDIQNYIELIDDPNTNYENGLFYMSEEQAKAILELKLHRLTGLEREKIHADLVDLADAIKGYLEILGNHSKIVDIIRNEMIEVRDNFANPRKTEISDAELDMDLEDLIAREDMVVTVSNTGYIKRVPLDTYRAQRRGGKGRSAMTTKEEDYVTNLFVANTHTPLIFFSNRGIAYRLKTYSLPAGNPTSKGKPLINVLPLQQGEVITTVMPMPENEAEWGNIFLMFATSNGTVRRNKLSDFESIRAGGKIAMKLEDGDTLVNVLPCTDKDDIFLASYQGKCIRFSVDEIRVFAGRQSVGVRGIKLANNDRVINMAILNHSDEDADTRLAFIKQSRLLHKVDADLAGDDDETTNSVISKEKFEEMQKLEQLILTISENGFGKRTSSYEYRLTHRGGSGIANLKLGGKNTAVAGSFPVLDTQDIMMVTDGGKIIRIAADTIRFAGRQTAGVTLFNTADNEKVVSAVAIESEQEDAIAEEGVESPQTQE